MGGGAGTCRRFRSEGIARMAGNSATTMTGGLGPSASTVMRHYRQQVKVRRLYTVIAIVAFLIVLAASLDFANSANSGKFFERLP